MNIKRLVIVFIFSLIIFNIIFVLGYFNYFVIPNIEEDTNIIQNKINDNIIDLSKNLGKYTNIDDAIKKYQNDHSSSIYIEDSDGNIVYNNADFWDNKLNYYMSRLININGTTYLVKLFEPLNWNILKSINSFIIFEILTVFIITGIIFGVIQIKFVKPLDKLQKVINNYKFGVKPKIIKAKSELDLIQNDFVDLVESLENSKENQKMIISSISHDIKTPITSILGYSEILSNSKVDKKTKDKYFNIIYQKALSLKKLSDEFENYLYESNYINLERIKVSELKNKIELDYKIDLSNNNINLKVNLKNGDEYIYLDLNKLNRVFSNIIGNSVRYLKDGGIIEINGMMVKNFYQFEISDNGTGTKQDLNKIFDPLFTTDKTRKISGLGLSICKEIIELHGGIISAYNNKLGGLTIRFTIINNKI